MSTYGAYGSLNYEVSDGTPGGVFARSGALRVTIVSGATRTGLYAPDGSVNVVLESSGALSPPGMYHPCGALRLQSVGTSFGVFAPNGALVSASVAVAPSLDFSNSSNSQYLGVAGAG